MLEKITQYILNIGVTNSDRIDDKLTSALNIISVLSAITGVFVSFLSYVFAQDPIYTTVTFAVACIHFNILVFHYFKLIRVARLYISIIMPLWYISVIVLIGGYFSQSVVAAADIGVTFLLFRRETKLRNGLISYNVFLFIGGALFSSYCEPVFGFRDYPLDEILVFLSSMVWISLVFYFYEENMQNHIISLKKKNQELNQKTTELERFAYIASHDLKSPLRNVISFLSIVSKNVKKGNYENLSEYTDFAVSGAKQMNELIESVLEISNIDKGADKKKYTEIDLDTCLDLALTNLNEDIQRKKAVINYDKLPQYFGNKTHFVLIFQNIIQNAIKYNESEPPIIDISCGTDNSYLILEIKDNGIGIKEEFQEQIFSFFTRLHTHSEYNGTGLGLGLVKKLIEQYEGSISVESVFSEYSIFTLKLPLTHKIAQPIRSSGIEVFTRPLLVEME